MIELGAEQVLIDGAVDRRAASSPAVADGLVMATGAVLGRDIEHVATVTADAVEVVRLPLAADAGGGIVLERQLVLGGGQAEIAALLQRHADESTFVVDGALSERFLEGLLAARRGRPAPCRLLRTPGRHP